MASHRFQCTPPVGSSDTFEVELPQELLSRSHVLRNAVSLAGSAPPVLQLPAGATCSFFDEWKALVQNKTSIQLDLTLEQAIAGLQVGSRSPATSSVPMSNNAPP